MQSIDIGGSSKNPINRVMDYKLHQHGIFGVVCRCPTRIGHWNWYDSLDGGRMQPLKIINLLLVIKCGHIFLFKLNYKID